MVGRIGRQWRRNGETAIEDEGWSPRQRTNINQYEQLRGWMSVGLVLAIEAY